MENQKIFDLLADTESALFYAKNAAPEDESILTAWEAARKALEAFAAATGCRN